MIGYAHCDVNIMIATVYDIIVKTETTLFLFFRLIIFYIFSFVQSTIERKNYENEFIVSLDFFILLSQVLTKNIPRDLKFFCEQHSERCCLHF